MSRVALVTDDLDVERRLFQGIGPDLFAELVKSFPALVHADPAQAAAVLGAAAPDVVVLGPRMDAMTGLAVAERLDRSHPDITTIIVTETSPELWELALQAGVRAVLPPDVDPSRMREVIERALELADRRRQNTVIDIREPERTSSSPESAPSGRVITVIAPKGGSGKTTMSTNLAAGLARYVPDGVALVDLDLQFGDVADALRLDPKHTIGDIRGRASQLDSAELKMLLTRHDSGLYALCAPEDPAAGEEIGPDDVSAALSVLAADLPYVVVDTAAGIDEASLTAIEMSTDLVLLASLDVPSIRNLRKLLLALDRLGLTRPTRHLVVNRAGSKVGIDIADVEATLGMPVAVAVPSSRTITLSVNYGEPLTMSDPKGQITRPFNDLVARFTDVPAARSGGFAWFRRNGR
jgi:pilus assembly protein CpaE